jgi:hypothetical protein
VVHLRINVPPDLTERVLHVLEQAEGACNIVVLRGASLRPEGDVLLCDVAREAASIVLADLQELGVTERGSIAVEQLDVVLSRAAEAAERAPPGDPANAVVWEQVEELASESTTLTASFMIFMVLSTLIAAVGIFLDTPILIIGAMVLGPEFRAAGELLRRRRGAAFEACPALVRCAGGRFSGRDRRRLPGIVDLQMDQPNAGPVQRDGSQLGGDHLEP